MSKPPSSSNKKKQFATIQSLLPVSSMQKLGKAQLGLFPDTPVTFKKSRISQEFQSFALYLAHSLNDLEHKHIYLKMAKTIQRGVLERALSFVTDAHHAENKAKLFMWKVKHIRQEQQDKKNHPDKKIK